MQRKISRQLLPYLLLLGISGCASGMESPSARQTVVPAATNTHLMSGTTVQANQNALAVSFQVCQNLPDWDRPEWSTQLTELQQNPRYGENLNQEPLKSLSEKFWNQSIITFTTYGLSARVEPIYLSGLWTAMEAIESCYDTSLTEAINRGQLAEIWLFGHRVLDIEWVNGQYSVTVESSESGLQLVLFERVETSTLLPIVVTSVNGSAMAVASGDW